MSKTKSKKINCNYVCRKGRKWLCHLWILNVQITDNTEADCRNKHQLLVLHSVGLLSKSKNLSPVLLLWLYKMACFIAVFETTFFAFPFSETISLSSSLFTGTTSAKIWTIAYIYLNCKENKRVSLSLPMMEKGHF